MIDIFRNIICSTGQVEQHSIFIALGTTTDALKNEFLRHDYSSDTCVSEHPLISTFGTLPEIVK